MKLTPLDTGQVSQSAKKMLDFLKSRVVGQDRALRYLTAAAERANSPLRDKKRPIGSFLFLGPSGVGKTETARALAKYLFDDEQAMAFVDCTKFTEPHTVSMLKGSPPGYVGFIDPARNQRSEYPLLSHWNVYKHHHLYLEKLHQEELDLLFDEMMELDDLGEEIVGLVEKAGKARKEIESSTAVVAYFQREIAKLKTKGKLDDKGATELAELQENLAVAKDQLKKDREELNRLDEERKAKNAEYSRKKGKNREIFLNAHKNGWLYDDDQPPENLMAVAVFDEIEKSAVEMHDNLMEIIDMGIFHCDNGLTTPFYNTFVIMTSNAGQERISTLMNQNSQIGFHGHQGALSPEELDQRIYDISMEEIKKVFRIEFLNRFDKIVVYRPLNQASLRQIFEIRVSDLIADLQREKFGLTIKFDEAAKARLIELAMKRSEEGARLLKKRLTDYVRDALVSLSNTGQIKAGDTVVVKFNGQAGEEELAFFREEN